MVMEFQVEQILFIQISKKKVELGKYTWKASTAFLKEQVAGAAVNDMGLTTTIFQNDNCTKSQKECNDAPKPRDEIDLPDDRLML